MRTYPHVELFGIPISRMNMQDTLYYLVRAIQTRTSYQVVTINPIMIMEALQDPAYMKTLQNADLLVPDGTGVVWAAARKGMPVAERVTGIDLIDELLQLASVNGWRVYLLGASPEVIEAARDILADRFPGAQFVGYRDGYFSDEEDEAVLADIREKSPDLLFVGRSSDKQEPWLGRYREQLDVPVMMGVGGSFDVISGKLKRAPRIWQKLRLEWLYRLLQEPWRYKRMLALPRFVLRVLRDRSF